MSGSSLQVVLQKLPANIGEDDYSQLSEIFASIELLQQLLSDTFGLSDSTAVSSGVMNSLFSFSAVAAIPLANQFVGLTGTGQATNATTSNLVGYVFGEHAAGDVVPVVLQGVVTNDSWALLAGQQYRVSSSGPVLDDGTGYTSEGPASVKSGIVGIALNATTLIFNPRIGIKEFR